MSDTCKILECTLKPGMNEVFMPNYATYLRAGVKNNRIVLWILFLSELENELKTERFFVAPTGQDFQHDHGQHLGVVQMKNGDVFHVFKSE